MRHRKEDDSSQRYSIAFGPHEMEMYLLAREVIRANPTIGKERLATLVGCVPNSAGRFLARFEGETHGHSNEPAYQQLLLIVQQNKHWTKRQVIHGLVLIAKVDVDRAKRLLARYQGATQRAAELTPGTDWRKHIRPQSPKLGKTALYAKIKALVGANPGIGMQKLARMAGCRTRTARRLREQYRGETQGHATDLEYQRLLDLIEQRQSHSRKSLPGANKLASKLGVSKTKAGVLLARYKGAATTRTSQEPGLNPTAVVTELSQGRGGVALRFKVRA